MRKAYAAGAFLGLVATTLMAVPAQANNIGEQGCTPGYWKNHPSSWVETPTSPAIPGDTLVNSTKIGFKTSADTQGLTMMQALQGGGGTGFAGAQRILMRAATAAWLNAANEGVGYPYRRWVNPFNIVGTTNAAIASGDRDTMLQVASVLDDANNLGCPLS